MSRLRDAIDQFNQFLEYAHGDPEETTKKWQRVQPVHIMEQVEKIEQLTDRMVMPDPIDFDALCRKLQSMYEGSSERLSRREIRNIPTVLFSDSLSFSAFLWVVEQHVEFFRARNVRRLLVSYFQNYLKNKDKEKVIKIKLLQVLQEFPAIKERIPLLRQYPDILEEGTMGLGEKIVCADGITESLKNISFFRSCFKSDFVLNAIRRGFQNPMTLDIQMQLLKEVSDNYPDVYPYVVGYVIKAADKDGSADNQTELMKLTYKQMGDPRDDGIVWSKVDEDAKFIYCQWLVKNDFTLFFSVIKQSASQTDAGERMWKFREAFWSAYVNDIRWSKVILGDVGIRIVKQLVQQKKVSLLNYDKLSSSTDKGNVCLLMMRIGKFTFIEVSYNGKLRIYMAGKEPIPFSSHHLPRTYNYYHDVVQRYAQIMEFVHVGSENYRWQTSVANWIQKNCGISRKYDDWKLS